MRWSIRMIDDENSNVEDIVNFPSDTPVQYIRDTLSSLMRATCEGVPRIHANRDFMECWMDGKEIIFTASLGNGEEAG